MTETEIERLVVRLVGDNSEFRKALIEAAADAQKHTDKLVDVVQRGHAGAFANMRMMTQGIHLIGQLAGQNAASLHVFVGAFHGFRIASHIIDGVTSSLGTMKGAFVVGGMLAGLPLLVGMLNTMGQQAKVSEYATKGLHAAMSELSKHPASVGLSAAAGEAATLKAGLEGVNKEAIAHQQIQTDIEHRYDSVGSFIKAWGRGVQKVWESVTGSAYNQERAIAQVHQAMVAQRDLQEAMANDADLQDLRVEARVAEQRQQYQELRRTRGEAEMQNEVALGRGRNSETPQLRSIQALGLTVAQLRELRQNYSWLDDEEQLAAARQIRLRDAFHAGTDAVVHAQTQTRIAAAISQGFTAQQAQLQERTGGLRETLRNIIVQWQAFGAANERAGQSVERSRVAMEVAGYSFQGYNQQEAQLLQSLQGAEVPLVRRALLDMRRAAAMREVETAVRGAAQAELNPAQRQAADLAVRGFERQAALIMRLSEMQTLLGSFASSVRSTAEALDGFGYTAEEALGRRLRAAGMEARAVLTETLGYARDSQHVLQQNMTAEETFAEEAGRLQRLLDSGTLSWEIYGRAVGRAASQLQGATAAAGTIKGISASGADALAAMRGQMGEIRFQGLALGLAQQAAGGPRLADMAREMVTPGLARVGIGGPASVTDQVQLQLVQFSERTAIAVEALAREAGIDIRIEPAALDARR